MNTKKLNRRNFLKITGLISLSPLLNSCSNPVISSIFDRATKYQPKPKVDILIEGGAQNIATTVRGKHQILKSIAENPGKELKIGYESPSGYGILRISFVKDNLASYTHLKIINERTGEIANILWGMDGIYPSIKFVDSKGKTITKNGYELEFPLKLKNLPSTNSTLSARDWLLIGLKVFAVALAIWLGLSISKLVISALSFLAFNALVIGLLIVGLSVVIPLVKWILDVMGITFDDVVSIFEQAIDLIVSTLLSIVDYLTNYFKK
jgi:hypothetical protein